MAQNKADLKTTLSPLIEIKGFLKVSAVCCSEANNGAMISEKYSLILFNTDFTPGVCALI